MTEPPPYYVTATFKDGLTVTLDARTWTEALSVKNRQRKLDDVLQVKIEDQRTGLDRVYTRRGPTWTREIVKRCIDGENPPIEQ